MKDKKETLLIPEEDAATHEHAGLLGSNIELGLGMYKDLQNMYLENKTSQSKPKKHDTADREQASHTRPKEASHDLEGDRVSSENKSLSESDTEEVYDDVIVNKSNENLYDSVEDESKENLYASIKEENRTDVNYEVI